ncbi:hypothetical protein AO379_0889 [Moraxella catarrhalis]|nr:hypothetical protein AO379_0889 [Moraxella catarrhalis]
MDEYYSFGSTHLFGCRLVMVAMGKFGCMYRRIDWFLLLIIKD